MNIHKIFRAIINFMVPTPATVRRHRAPSARFVTLAALAASQGASLKRHGRNYNLITSDSRVFQFENLAQVKAYLTGDPTSIDCSQHNDNGAVGYKSGAFVANPNAIFTPNDDSYSIGEPPTRLGNPGFMKSECDLSDDFLPQPDRPRNLYTMPDGKQRLYTMVDGKLAPFVPVTAVPITNDIVRE